MYNEEELKRLQESAAEARAWYSRLLAGDIDLSKYKLYPQGPFIWHAEDFITDILEDEE